MKSGFIYILIFVLNSDLCLASDTFKDLTTSIYCPSCQGQVLDESNSPLAVQMKQEIWEMLKEGRSPQEIKEHYKDLYGQQVLLMPSLEVYTYLLWLAPFLVLVIIIYTAMRRMRFIG